MSNAPQALESYLSSAWRRGEGVETELVDPVRGDVLATASARGLDLNAALDYARRTRRSRLAWPVLRRARQADRCGGRCADRQSREI